VIDMDRNEGESMRAYCVREARRLFIDTGATRNISTALTMFLRAHVRDVRGVTVWTTKHDGASHALSLYGYEMPRCRRCGAPLRFSPGCVSCKGPVKKNRWVCLGCGLIRYTKDTLEEALKKLKKVGDGES